MFSPGFGGQEREAVDETEDEASNAESPSVAMLDITSQTSEVTRSRGCLSSVSCYILALIAQEIDAGSFLQTRMADEAGPVRDAPLEVVKCMHTADILFPSTEADGEPAMPSPP